MPFAPDFRQLIKNWVGPLNQGRIRYYLHPDRRDGWGGAFNGQEQRQAIFLGIVRECQPGAYVETGTFLGTTTEFIAQSTHGKPVFTVEHSPLNLGTSQERLRKQQQVRLRLGDSRGFLKDLIANRELPAGPVFYYLDAHWSEDLPLAEELAIIFGHQPDAIVMVDDFQVPWDSGYTYDNYGPDKALTPSYIAASVAQFGLTCFYPAAPATQETGARRGTVVLTADAQLARQLAAIPQLRQAHASDLQPVA